MWGVWGSLIFYIAMLAVVMFIEFRRGHLETHPHLAPRPAAFRRKRPSCTFVLYHDNCFDGATSAALFSEFYRRCVLPDAQFEYVGMNHGPGDVCWRVHRRTRHLEHVCVDFRYSTDSWLSWWFDHHQSAFLSDQDQAHFHAAQNRRHFYDPKAQSCSKFWQPAVAARSV